MKTLFKTMTMIAAVFVISSCTVQKQQTVSKALIKTTITCDHCKQCETCGGLLEQTLLKTSGIQMITLNEKEATIEVIYNTKKTSLPEIKTAISKLGYDADEIKADPAGYAKLDECCKPS
ncbi:MAG TPA: cation transporter [Flavobacterium sp.]|jgi:copper chaperone CopZ